MKSIHSLFFLGAIVLLGVTSCVDESFGVSTAMDNTIQVKAMVGSGTGTKAGTVPESGETTETALQSFSLTAWQTSVDNSIIDNATFTKSDSKFSTTGTYYWPEGLVRFWAYADTNKVATSGLPQFSVSRDSVTMTYSLETIKQDDPVFAYVSQKKHLDDNNVNLNFQHMLSRVSINAYAPYFSEGYLRVVSFGFKNVRTGATFVYECEDDTTTVAPFDTTVWRSATTGNIGGISVGTDTSRWYVKSSGDTNSSKTPLVPWVAGNGPVVKKTLQAYPAGGDANKSRLAYVDGSTLKVQVPWLNVVPGVKVADSLIVTYEYYNPKTVSEGGHKWITKVARLALGSISVCK